MERLLRFFRLIISLFLICCVFVLNTKNAYASSNVNTNHEEVKEIKRSLESLRDFDAQTWQIIVYPSSKNSNNLILRIVGYPGSLRIDHPTNLLVKSGIRKWDLQDITKPNKAQVESLSDSVAEFYLSPLIAQLDKNRPLRLSLPGLINDLPIPPYLVSEWRTLVEEK